MVYLIINLHKGNAMKRHLLDKLNTKVKVVLAIIYVFSEILAM